MARDAAAVGEQTDATRAKSERERAWEQIFLRLLSLERERTYNLVVIIDRDGYPSGGVTSEGKLEWQGKRPPS